MKGSLVVSGRELPLHGKMIWIMGWGGDVVELRRGNREGKRGIWKKKWRGGQRAGV